MWNAKCFIMPVIIRTAIVVTTGLENYVETIPRRHSVDALQKKMY
jgi:hypothetical protein